MGKEIPYRFDVEFESDSFSPEDPQLRKGKVRVFYTGLNRNGSYITPEFGAKLALTAYMKPIVGTYDVIQGDFLGHDPSAAKAYGFVLPDSLEWIEHLDKDGITRTYAAYDVIVWAEYWDEAKKIFDKSQSMEIMLDSIQGSWEQIDEQDDEAFIYSDGSIAGLTVLGELREPCFEGAAFFSMEDESYKKFSLAIKNYFQNGGKNAMFVKIAGFESDKFEQIWDVLNPNFNEEGAFSIENVPFFEDEESVYAYACGGKKKSVKKYDKVTGEDNSFSLTENSVMDFDLIAAERDELQNKFDVANSAIEQLNGEKAALETEKDEAEQRFETEKAALIAQYEELKATYEALKAQNNKMAGQNAAYEAAEKDRIIAKFINILPADVLQEYSDNKTNYSISELNTQLAVEYTNFSFSPSGKEKVHFPKPASLSEYAAFLNKYKRN